MERFAWPHFRFFSPRLRPVAQPRPTAALEPFEVVRIPRPSGAPGVLEGTWFPARDGARGAVLLLPPWIEWGRAYFHRRDRIPALRAAGYHALTLDYPGLGDSGPATRLPDLDVEAALEALAARAQGLPVHVWGVSAGGYWAHQLLARSDRALGAMFEDVSPHLIEWGWRVAPLYRPGYLLLRLLYPSAYRFLDLRRHAPALRVRRCAYVSGALDEGVRPEDTRELARLAGAPVTIVPGADHLEAIKKAQQEVIGLALQVFAEAEGRG